MRNINHTSQIQVWEVYLAFAAYPVHAQRIWRGPEAAVAYSGGAAVEWPIDFPLPRAMMAFLIDQVSLANFSPTPLSIYDSCIRGILLASRQCLVSHFSYPCYRSTMPGTQRLPGVPRVQLLDIDSPGTSVDTADRK